MMPAQCFLTSSLALLVLLDTVRAGPFSPRYNVTLPAPRPPPQPGGRTAEPRGGSPSSQLYEHNVEGGEKQVVFTHRINLPPSAGCGCPPGTEPPIPASEVQALRVRLEILEELVKGLKEQCTGGCCPAAAQAGTGQTDVRSLCSLHGVFDLSRCACSCEPGWGGPTCSDPTDARVTPSSPPSASGSCPDDCNDQGRCVRGRCVCFPGYSGPSCGWPSCPKDCHGRGRCVQGVCVCRTGFSGEDCSLRSCPRGCSQRGRCEDGRCVCDPGYTGEDCGKKGCPRSCSQRGRCENGRCVCNPGYTGEDCAVRSCPRGCSQKGRCEDGRCVCDPGHTGEDCGARTCPWDCGEGGRCVDGRCVCWPGYTGDDCSTRTCPRDCRGRGRCEDGECICDAGYSGDDCGVRSCPLDCSQRGRCEDGRCVCWPGYTGPDCGARACPRDCRGRGRCENGVCVCNAGYSGEDCGVRSCPGDCRGRGRCENGRCVCWPGYTGRDCSTRACPGDCRGRGRCVDGRCVCNPGFTGDDCGSRRCPGDCRGRGRCEDGMCMCSTGYEGEDCGTRSCPGGCRGRGQCLDGRCVCDDGYSGEDCGMRRCPRDCSQHGVCQDGVCACWEGYAGEDCGLRTCPSNCHGRGRCEEGRCVCDSGYTGPSCATRTCLADCRGRGRCVQGVCVCYAGYSGEDCGQEEPPASACPGGCGPRELCRSGQCVCVEGFRGPDCAIQTCPADCRGRGECRDGSCVCQDGYAGEDCGEEVPAIESMRMHLLEETTVRTEWTRAPGTVDAYEIQFIPTTEGVSPPFTARVPSSASAYDQRGLDPGQEYQVTIRALRGTNWGPPASKTITTMIDGPQDLRVVAVTPTTLELGWLRPQAEVDRFVVSYVSAGNQRVRLEVPSEADGTLLTDLMPGVEYVVTVTAERGQAVSYPASIRANTEGVDRVATPRHPKPEVLGSSADGALLVSLDGLRGHFERVVLRWRPQVPAEGPGGELTVPGTTRTVSLPDLRPGTTYHVEVHGVRAGQTSKSYAFITTTGSSPSGLLGATDEPPPSGPSTTQGVQAPILQQRPQGLGELRVLGRDKTGRLQVAWTAQPDTFAHFHLQLRVPKGPGAHEELLPGDVHQALVPSPPPGAPYELSLRGVPPEGEPSAPLVYQGIMDRDGEKPGKPMAPPRLSELTVMDGTSNSLLLHWTVPEGEFDSFVIQYKDRDGPQVVPVEGPQRSALITNLDLGRKYKFILYGLVGKKKHGPLVAEAKIYPQEVVDEPPSPTEPSTDAPEPPEEPLLGELTVTGSSPDSLSLSWTVPQGHFDSFTVQYKDREGRPQVVRVGGEESEVTVGGLEPGHKYKMHLYGLHGGQRMGPVSTTGLTAPQTEETPPATEPPLKPRLGELTVTGVTPNSVGLSWTVPEGQFDSFVVQYKDRDGQPQVVPVAPDQCEVTVPSLEPSRKYKFLLFGIQDGKRRSPVSVEAKTAAQGDAGPGAPPHLGELLVTDPTQDSLRLSWTVPEGHFDSFVVQFKDRDGPRVVPVDGHERSVTITPLDTGRKYRFLLYGLLGKKRHGPLTADGTTETQDNVDDAGTKHPPKPRLGEELQVTSATPDSVSLLWTVPEGQFESFVIQYKDSNGQPRVVPVDGSVREVSISGLEPAHRYKLLLYGLHGGKRVGPVSTTAVTALRGETESETEASSPPVLEPHLGEVTVKEATLHTLHLSWTVTGGEFNSFEVQYTDEDGQQQVVRLEGDRNDITLSGLEPDRRYLVNLYGLHGRQRVGPAHIEVLTVPREEENEPSELPTMTPQSPTKPRLGELAVTDATPNSLHLSWTIPEGQFDHFLVQYKNGDGQAVRVQGHEDGVTISGLEPDHKYKMNLYGFHGGQRVGPVSAIGVTAPEEKPPSPPEPSSETPEPPEELLLGELTVTGSSPDSLSLSWTVPRGHFDSFTVQYKDREGRPQVVRVGGEESEVTVGGLEPGRKYKMHLYGLHGGQRVGPVSTVGVTAPRKDREMTPDPRHPPTTTPEPPTKPHLGELTVTDATPDSLHLSWTIPEGQFDHFLVQYKNGDGKPKAVRVQGHEDGVTISGLEPDHKYKMNLYGFHGGQRVGPVSAIGVTAAEEEPPSPTEPSSEAPEPPEEPLLGELTVTGSSPDSLSLSWTVSQGHFDSFTVQYKDREGRPQVVRVGGEESEVTVGGLEPGRKYKMHLYGLHGGQRVGPVSTVGMTATKELLDNISSSTEVKDTPSPTEPSSEAPDYAEEPLLGELTVTGSSADSLSLSWTVPQGHFDSFTVQYKDREGWPQVVHVRGEESEVTVGGLEPGRKYKMHLYGLHGGQRVGPVSTIGVTAPDYKAMTTQTPSTTTPEPPTKPRLGELTVTDATPDSLHLSWTVPEGQFDHFLVQYKNGDGQPKAVRVQGHKDGVTISGLEPDHKYKMNLYGFHGGQRVGPVSAIGVTAAEEEPPSPTEPSSEAPEPPEEPLLGELTVTGSSPDSLSLSWTVSQGHFDSFTVQYKDREGQPQVVRVGGEESEVTVGGLEPGRKYKMHLYGLHGGQRMGPVSTVGVTAPDYKAMTTQTPSTMTPEPPTKPRLGELAVTDATPDSLHLSWTVPEGQFDHFLVQYKNGDGQPKAVRVQGHEDGVTISGLEPDHKYKMNLYGFHGGQRVGPVSAIGVTAAEEEPPSPTEPSSEAPEPPEEPLLGELTVTGSSPDSLSLSWTVPRGHFDSFTVQYKDREGQPQVVRVGGEESEVTVGGLEPGRKYKMHLYGLHGGQRVGPVSTVGVTAPLSTEPLMVPRLGELAVAAMTSDTARLSWTVAQGPFDSFLVQYKDAQGQPQAVPIGGDLREVTVSGLDPAHKYKFLLFGLRDGKRLGPVSTEAKTNPDRKHSPRLGELTVMDVTPDSMRLSWTVPEGKFDSFVVQYKDRVGQPQVVPVATDHHEVTITHLEPNRKYKFLLYGLAGRKRLGPISADGTTAALEKERQPLPRLGALTVTDETPDSLRLSWTVAQGSFDSFVVQYRDTNGQPRAVSVAEDQREVTIEGLEPGRKYKFLLYGLLKEQRLGPISVLGVTAPEEDTAASSWRPATEAPEPPEEPHLRALTVSSVTPDSLHLSWTVAQGPFDSFVVQYQDIDGRPQALLVGGDQNKVLVSGLEPSTSYRFFLYGLRRGSRLGPVSAEGTTGPAPAGQTPGEPGPHLSQLSVTDVTTSSMRLNWEAPPGAFDSFLLRFGVPSASTLEPHPSPLMQRELTVSGTQRSAVLRDLRPGTLYSLTLYGLRGPHKADSIQGTARTLSPVLESPSDLQFSEIGETSAKVSWMPPPSRVDSFKVSYQLADGGEPQSVQVDGRAQTQKLKGLIPGVHYEVTVVSVRGFEESEPLTGFLTTVPDGPTQLRALNLTEESALLHWKPPQAPVDTYDVQVTAPGGERAPPLQASAPGSAVDYALSNLELHTNYTATVRGLRGPNLTSPASITFTTGLEAPQDLEAKEVTPRTALLTWTEPQIPPSGYLLSFDTPGGQTQEILLPGGATSHQLLGLFPSTSYSAWLRALWGESLTPPVSTSFTTGGLRVPFPRDCGEEMENGARTSRATTIFFNGNRERPLSVFCDMETDGGGWLVFQRRMDGQTDFWRDWEDYAHGFGNISREFWLGNEALHSLTRSGDYSLRVDLRAGDEAVFAQYDSFRVDSAAENYRLHLEGYHGTAGDSMSYHSGSVFSARDRDPNNLLISCAVSYRGAWWYRNCHYANLNGLYGSTVDHQGVSWYYWKGFEFSVPFTEMKLRPRGYRPQAQGG
ncbi:tenascin-X isoform X3 [Manis pentadactyla]|uniref:tenascin-X isoform X3 n=1 Tax=Manis pentadactyla TaxID=143292 RepID=UPI00255C6575|nr:tenascin-X isoform X3 [Manis pentadactyla]